MARKGRCVAVWQKERSRWAIREDGRLIWKYDNAWLPDPFGWEEDSLAPLPDLPGIAVALSLGPKMASLGMSLVYP